MQVVMMWWSIKPNTIWYSSGKQSRARPKPKPQPSEWEWQCQNQCQCDPFKVPLLVNATYIRQHCSCWFAIHYFACLNNTPANSVKGLWRLVFYIIQNIMITCFTSTSKQFSFGPKKSLFLLASFLRILRIFHYIHPGKHLMKMSLPSSWRFL